MCIRQVRRNEIQSDVKRRKYISRMRDVIKKLWSSTNEISEDCLCFHYKSFQVILFEEGYQIISNFYKVGHYNKENLCLHLLITVLIKQHHNKKNDTVISNHISSYCYRRCACINVKVTLQDVSFYHRTFLALHSVPNHHIQMLKKQLPEFLKLKYGIKVWSMQA